MKVYLFTNNKNLHAYLEPMMNLFYPLGIDFEHDLAAADLAVIDTHTVSVKDVTFELPVLLFSNIIKPFLLDYTGELNVLGVIGGNMDAENLKETLLAAGKNEVYFDEEMLSFLFSNKTNERHQKVASLTQREMEIIKLMLKDLTNEQIATSLDLSIRTVNAHKGNIMRKVECNSTAGLITIAMNYSSEIRKLF